MRGYIQERSSILAPSVTVVTANHPPSTAIRGIAIHQKELYPYSQVRNNKYSEEVNNSVEGCWETKDKTDV